MPLAEPGVRGLGPTQAARHFAGRVTADELSFVDRQQVDIANLRAGSADLQNPYSQFELTQLGGTFKRWMAGDRQDALTAHREKVLSFSTQVSESPSSDCGKLAVHMRHGASALQHLWRLQS
jgi:hypothetical protein